MNCLETRRDLFRSPRVRGIEHNAHLATCIECARLASNLNELDRRIEEAALIALPDGIAHRVLLARAREARPRSRQLVEAFLLAVVVLSVVLVGPPLIDMFEYAGTAEAVGPEHPGVAAISLIVNDEQGLPDTAEATGSAEITRSLKELGLTLGAAEATTYYVGKCHIAGGGCEHILLSTTEGYANVLLLPHHVIARRILVTHRRMTALVNPAPNGGYIVVTQSPKAAKRTGRLFRRG